MIKKGDQVFKKVKEALFPTASIIVENKPLKAKPKKKLTKKAPVKKTTAKKKLKKKTK
jgi:hypothetical protein